MKNKCAIKKCRSEAKFQERVGTDKKGFTHTLSFCQAHLLEHLRGYSLEISNRISKAVLELMK